MIEDDPIGVGTSTCGCCEGVQSETPAEIDNRPGLPAVAARIGNYSQFFATMRAALSARERPALADLKTRDSDDFSIALLDAWACVADVLTFYNERISNESYLSTATERFSVLQLAREIGYELRPGVAASGWLSFVVEQPFPPATTGAAQIPAGTQVQSIPGPGEKPQTYETDEPLFGRYEWNLLRPQSTRTPVPFHGMTELRLAGITTNLKVGDTILVVGDERTKNRTNDNWDVRRVRKVDTFPDADASKAYSLVTVDHPLGSFQPWKEPSKQNAQVFALRQKASFFGYNAPDARTMPKDFPSDLFDTGTPKQWKDFGLGAAADSGAGGKYSVALDSSYPAILPESWIVIEDPAYLGEVYEVLQSTESGRTAFTVSGKSTELTIDGENLREKFENKRRSATIFGQSEELRWAREPVFDGIFGDRITLDRAIPELPVGRALFVSGIPSRVRVTKAGAPLELDLDGTRRVPLAIGDVLTIAGAPVASTKSATARRWLLRDDADRLGSVDAEPNQLAWAPGDQKESRVSEIVYVKRVELTADGLTRIVLEDPLRFAYDPRSMEILGNVAPTTHGETVSETAGHGNASVPHQRMWLKQKPVTYTPADTPSGGETSLSVWVDGVRWKEVPTLYDTAQDDRVYVVRHADEGETSITFGDGHRGSRLPTGHDNVEARYRKGIGREGLVRAGQLSLLLSKPLGVKSAANPRATEGAADPERLSDARLNAPLTVLTLDRAVSLRDYEDFARAFSGISRAHAVWTWEVNARGVFITVAGIDGAKLNEDSETITKLTRSLREFGNPLVSVRVRGYRPVTFAVAATVTAMSDRDPDQVLAAVKETLTATYSFSQRSFAQAVTLADVMAAIQRVPGVDSVDITAVNRDGSGVDDTIVPETPRSGSSGGDAQLEPAELITLDLSSLGNVTVRTR